MATVSDVRFVQRWLNSYFSAKKIKYPKLTVDGKYGHQTRLAIAEAKRCIGWQGRYVNGNIGSKFKSVVGLTKPKYKTTAAQRARGAAYRATLRARFLPLSGVGKRGLDLLVEFECGGPEGVKRYLAPYNDPVGYSTVGIGHLIAYRNVNDADRRARWVPNQQTPGRLTVAEAYTLLENDLKKDYVPQVKAIIKGIKGVTQNMFDALVSLAYNVGVGGLASSTVIKRLRAGDKRGAGDAFMMWTRAGGVVLDGLVRRRRAERALFLS